VRPGNLILIVFDFLAIVHHHLKPADRQFEPLFETALQQELQGMFVTWLKQVPSNAPVLKEELETMARVISWAIFGPVVQWSRGARTLTAEEMARHVLAVVTGALSDVIGFLA